MGIDLSFSIALQLLSHTEASVLAGQSALSLQHVHALDHVIDAIYRVMHACP